VNQETLMALVDDCDKAKCVEPLKDRAEDRTLELERLGFKSLAQKMMDKVTMREKLQKIHKYCYVKITDKKIKKFLYAKAEQYNKEHEKKEKETMIDSGGLTRSLVDSAWRSSGSDYERARDTYFQLRQEMTRDMDRLVMHPWSSLNLDYGDSSFRAGTCDRQSNRNGTIGFYEWKETPIESYETVPPDSVLKVMSEHKSRNLFDSFTIASVNAVHDPLLLGRLRECDDRYFISQWGNDVALDDVI